MNTSVKVILFKSKTLSNGEHPVMLRIIKDRKPKYISTGINCSDDLWDEKLSIPKKNHPLYKEAKILIGKKKLDAEKLIYNLENENDNLSAFEIKGKLRKGKVNSILLFSYFDIVIERLKVSGQVKNSEIYKDTRRNLYHYIGKGDIPFSQVDVSFLNKFEEFLKSKGKGGNTIYLYLRTLRALINKAIKEQVCNEKYYPFSKFSLSKYANIKTAKRSIQQEDVAKIKNLKIKEPDLLLARDVFMFGYYCRGMNFTDIAFLKWENIKSNRMIYERKKTKELFNIELLEPAKDILGFYRPVTFTGSQSYVFPILNENHITPTTIYNRKVKMLKMVNRNLKEIGKKTGIAIDLTTYVSRHTYAWVLKKNGISTTIISQAMGHDSEKTTQIYLNDFENKILDEASKKIL